MEPRLVFSYTLLRCLHQDDNERVITILEQRRITFNDDGQSAVGSTRVTSATLHLHVQAATNYTPSPSRHYYPRLIVGTNLPTPMDSLVS